MQPFRFRLETVLRLRQSVEDRKKSELAEALGVREQQLRRQAALEGELTGLKRRVQDLGAAGRVDMEAVVNHRQYATALDFGLRRIAESLRLIDEEVDRRQAALTEAMRERKVIEKLRERQYETYREEAGRVEQRELDEIAVGGFRRQSAED